MPLRTSCIAGFAVAVLLAISGCQNSGTSADTPDRSHESPDFSAGISDPVKDPMYPDYGNSNIDVLNYSLKLDYDPGSTILSGTAILTIRPIKDSAQLALDFSDAMQISSLTVDEKTRKYTQHQYDLTVSTPLHKDQLLELSVSYSGTPELMPAPSKREDMSSGIGATTDRSGALWTFQEPYGALTWYPVNDHPSDEALYDIAITVPDGYAAVACGTFEGKTANTFSWRSSAPIASYAATIAVDRYDSTALTGPNDLPIILWIPQRYSQLTSGLEHTPDVLEWLVDHYGQFPFESAGVVLTGGRSAMETQQTVTFSASMSNIYDDEQLVSVLLHEMSHQWFGDAVTPQDWTSLWISEGAATYSEQMWNIDSGQKTESEVVSHWESEDAKLRNQFGPPGRADPESFASSNSYTCPALMLYYLRDEIGGRKNVDDLLAGWASSYRNKSVTRKDFIDFASEHSKKDLSGYFDEWLDATHTPT